MERDVGFVILAGGVGSRMRADGNKVYLEVRDRPMLTYSLESAVRSPRIARIVMVVRPEDQHQVEELIGSVVSSDRVTTVFGGSSRFASEHHGIESLRAEVRTGSVRTIAVHDGARPFVSPNLLEAVLARAAETGGCIPVIPVTDTLVSLDDGSVLPSQELAFAQTPQAFGAPDLVAAHQRAFDAAFEGVDTAQIIENYSDQSVSVVPGEPDNLKMTFQDDLQRATSLAAGLVEYFGHVPIDPYWTT